MSIEKQLVVEVRQVLYKPETLDKDGEITKPRYASVNLFIPLDTEEQEVATAKLSRLVSTEECFADIIPRQGRLDEK